MEAARRLPDNASIENGSALTGAAHGMAHGRRRTARRPSIAFQNFLDLVRIGIDVHGVDVPLAQSLEQRDFEHHERAGTVFDEVAALLEDVADLPRPRG